MGPGDSGGDTALPDTAVLGPLSPRTCVHKRTSQWPPRVSCRLWVAMLSPERARQRNTCCSGGEWKFCDVGPEARETCCLPLHLALNLKFLFKN